MSIEEQIRVTGADKAAQDIDRVADATEKVGDETEQSGGKAKTAEGKFGGLGSVLNSVKSAAISMVGGFMGLELVKRLVTDVVAALEKALELREKLAGVSVGLAGESKLLKAQLKEDGKPISEQRGMEVLTELRIAGGMDAASAREFGISADVALGDQGGLLAGQNYQTAKDVAAFAGAKGFSAQEAAQLFSLLKTAGKLGSPEEAQRATAQIAAAATESKAQSTGAFVAMVERGATGMLTGEAPVPFEDVLAMGGQARQVEVSEELAAQSLKTLQMVALGAEAKFTKEIERVALSQGLDAAKLTTAQRIGLAHQIFGGITTQDEENRIRAMLSPERAARLIPAFRASNVAATAGVAEAGRTATAADFQATVEQGRGEMTFRDAVSTAEREYQEALAGLKEFTLVEAYAYGESQHDIAQAQGREKERWLGEYKEYYVERYVRKRLEQQAKKLREQGVTFSDEVMDLGVPGYTYGYDDDDLRRLAQGIDLAEGQLKSGVAPRQITVNVTNIAANYANENPTQSPPDPDLGE